MRRPLDGMRARIVKTSALLVCTTSAVAFLFTGAASGSAGKGHLGARPTLSAAPMAHALWGHATDGAHGASSILSRGSALALLHGSPQLNAIAADIVGANDMVVDLEDDPIEWASLVGSGSESVTGFMVFAPPPSPLYHAIFIGPQTYPAWTSWFATGTPAGDEPAFAEAAMTLIHESYHWKLMSGDESAINACALRDFGYYLARDFNVPTTVTQTTTQQVPKTVTKRVPVTKTVLTKKRVKVHGKWVTRIVRKRVKTYVTKTTTIYITQTSETTIANPLYQTLVSDAQAFYASQPAPYNSGTCPAPTPGSAPTPPPPPPPSPTPPPVTATYHVASCWTQYTGGSWSNVNRASAVTSFSAADILARGGSNFWSIVQLENPPSETLTGTTLSLIEPNGATFYTYALPEPWPPTVDAWEGDFTWHWASDNTLFFQHPERTGSGTWIMRWTFPDGEVCNTPFTITL